MAEPYEKDQSAVAGLTPRRYAVTPGGRHRAGLRQRILGYQGGGDLRRRRIRGAPLHLPSKVRQRVWMTELHDSTRT